MRPTEDIKNLINKMEDKTSEQMDKKILKDILQTLEHSHKTQTPIGRFIMKNPIKKLAAAAVITFTAILGVHIFLGGGTSITIADIAEQLNKVTWMHGVIEEIEYTKDTPMQVQQQYKSESWTCLKPFRYITVTSDGDIRYNGDSSGENVSAQYEAATNKIIIKYPKNNHENLPADPLRLFLMQFEEIKKHGGKITYTRKDFEGVLAWYIDYDFTFKENIRSYGTLIVDLATRLPIKFSSNTGDINNESIRRNMSVLIDYPETGPTDIYSAGMPKGAIIEKAEDSFPTEFTKAIKEYHNARENIPEKYALVSIFAENNNTIRDVFLVYRNKEMKRVEHYSNRNNTGRPQENADFDSLVKWINESNFMSHNTKIQDGKYEYAAYPAANNEWSIRKERLGSYINIDLGGSQNNGDLSDLGWPMIVIGWPTMPIGSYSGHNYKVIQNEYSQSHNLLCYERLNQSVIRDGQVYNVASKNLFYVDPQRDYICVRTELYYQDTKTININNSNFDPESIPTEPCSIIEVTEFGTTPAGQWYPKKIHKSIRIFYHDSDEQYYSKQEEQTVFVYLDTNPVFPEGIFDTKNLP